MTWTYFTAFLDGSRNITQDERDELYDKLHELLTGQCVGLGYQVDVGGQAEIEASHILTDRIRLYRPALGTFTANRIWLLLTNISVGFSNYNAVRSAALAAEGISEAQWAQLLNSNLVPSHHHLWNFYKRMIDGLRCTPAITVRSRSASRTKCGHAEFGTPSSPPKRYLSKTQSGGLTVIDYLGSGYTFANTWSGSHSYSRATCAATDTRQLQVTVTGNCDNTATLTGLAGQADVPYGTDSGPRGCTVWDADCSSTTTAAPLFGCCEAGNVISPTLITFADASCGLSGSAVSVTLGSEYTTAMVLEDAETAMAATAWSAYSSFQTPSLHDKSTDELTATVRETEWKFSFGAALPAGYYLRFEIWFTPEGGSPVLDSSVCVDVGGLSEYVHAIGRPAAQGTKYVLPASVEVSNTPC